MFRMLLITLAFASLLLSGCSDQGNTLKVLAGSELKDVLPMVEDIRRATGVNLEFEFTGTLDGAETLAGGGDYDLGWFSHAKYLALLEGRLPHKVIHAAEKLMLSPVIAGVKRSVAGPWGWCDDPAVSWQAFADKAAAGELRYAMTNPASSNSGFSALVGVQSALAGGEALQVDMIDSTAMRGFAKGHKLTAGSSGWLSDKFVEHQDQVDAIFNYESVLIGLNESGVLREPLCLLYPPEGVVTADYPLLLLDPARREAFDKLVAYFKQPEVQARIVRETARRPVIPGMPLDERFPDAVVLELPFPGNVDTVDQVLLTYLDKQRAPTTSVFVLDTSGSMQGRRIDDLKLAMLNLAGADRSITGRFARFRARERVIVLPFNNQPTSPALFDIGSADPNDDALARLRALIDGLQAGGGTAIYLSLQRAYALAQAEQQRDPERFYSIVLMSDGENSTSQNFAWFQREVARHAEQYAGIPTFTVLFGDASVEEMQQLASLTGGRAFDSRKHSLADVFKQIRGYQ